MIAAGCIGAAIRGLGVTKCGWSTEVPVTELLHQITGIELVSGLDIDLITYLLI
jgi:hypothetical protein